MYGSSALVDRDVGAGRGGLLGVFLLAEELQEVDRLGRRGLGDEEGVDAAERVGRLALAAGDGRERHDADVVLRQALAAGGASGPACRCSHSPIRSIAALPSPKTPVDSRVLGREIARLERLERREFAQALARLDEGRVLEAAVLARLGVGERMLAADAHDEIGIVEVHRPFLAGADDDRRDAGRLQLLHRGEEVVPGLDVLGLDAGLREQLLVVEERDFAGVERHADGLAVDLERRRRRSATGWPRPRRRRR